MQAARVAASLRRDPGIPVELVEGHYGEFTVLVDGEKVASSGPLSFLGVLPSVRSVRRRVLEKLGAPGNDLSHQ